MTDIHNMRKQTIWLTILKDIEKNGKKSWE
jgi:hypothetical protein